jgi:hypothetical protein
MTRMGRHAARGENEPEAGVEVPVPQVVTPMGFADAVESLRPPGSRPQPIPRGRHAVPDEDEDAEPTVDVEPTAGEAAYDQVSHAVTDRLPQPPAATDAAERPPQQRARKQGATAADLHLLRTDPALRNRVIAAVVVPFVLFFVVLVLLGRLDAFAVWIWLPLISAGLGAGVLLDTGHARLKAVDERQEH